MNSESTRWRVESSMIERLSASRMSRSPAGSRSYSLWSRSIRARTHARSRSGRSAAIVGTVASIRASPSSTTFIAASAGRSA